MSGWVWHAKGNAQSDAAYRSVASARSTPARLGVFLGSGLSSGVFVIDYDSD